MPAGSSLEEFAQPLMNLVQRIYVRFPVTVASYFDSNTPRPSEASPAVIKASMDSFTVLRECPALLGVIFSTFGNLQQQSMPSMIGSPRLHLHNHKPLTCTTGLLVDAFCAQLPTQATGIKESLRPPQMRKALLELLASKVKLLVFLVTLQRSSPASLRQFQKRMPEAIIQLLLFCPHSDVATRKELLQNTRYVISVQELKADFQKYMLHP